MRNTIILLQLATLSILLMACSKKGDDFDAAGSFEAIERTISAEATGKIMRLDIQEGQQLQSGEVIGSIDVSNLAIQSEQVEASIQAISEKTNTATPQIMVLESQLRSQESQVAAIQQQVANIDKEVKRFQNLVSQNAAPQKQLDDLIGQKLVLQKQLSAAQSQRGVIRSQVDAAKTNVSTQNRAVLSEIEPNKRKLQLIQKQVKDGMIVNDFAGTVTTQIAYDGEFTSIGRPLYRIADLSQITLRAYVTGDQLAQIKLNQQVTVRTDDGEGDYKTTKGKITWISPKAEFTPKTIQTKNERANLVYAIKVNVSNDGSYKIGMYGEVLFK